jgi:hypothetical protein
MVPETSHFFKIKIELGIKICNDNFWHIHYIYYWLILLKPISICLLKKEMVKKIGQKIIFLAHGEWNIQYPKQRFFPYREPLG